MKLNYFMCKKWGECPLNHDCVFRAEPLEGIVYECLSFDKYRADTYLSALLSTDDFKKDLKRHLYAWLFYARHKLKLSPRLYYVVELDQFKLYGATVEALLHMGNPKGGVKDYNYIEIPYDWATMEGRIRNSLTELGKLRSFNEQNVPLKTYVGQLIDGLAASWKHNKLF